MSISNERPAYRILAIHGFFGPNDNLYQEGSEVYFDGEPNEEMEPLNELARVKLELYLENLDKLGRETAAKLGKAYAGRPRNLDGALEIATAVQRADMGLMGNKNKDGAQIATVEASEVSETGQGNKRKPGRPRTIASVAA